MEGRKEFKEAGETVALSFNFSLQYLPALFNRW